MPIIIDKAKADEITQNRLSSVVQKHLDDTAKTKGYDSILSACSYAAYPNTYQAESQKFLSWRAACWDKCYRILAEVKAGTRAVPTGAELIAALPVLV